MIVINTVRDYLRSSGYKLSLNWVDSEDFISGKFDTGFLENFTYIPE